MFNDDTQAKLTHIIQGSRIPGQTDHCTAVRNHLCSGFATSTTVKANFESNALIKKEQELNLKQYASQHNLWIGSLPGKYLTRGGESQVYLEDNGAFVVKINDAVYYATWLEYFNSLLLHNLIFPDTEYTFLGFIDWMAFSMLWCGKHSLLQREWPNWVTSAHFLNTMAFKIQNGRIILMQSMA